MRKWSLPQRSSCIFPSRSGTRDESQIDRSRAEVEPEAVEHMLQSRYLKYRDSWRKRDLPAFGHGCLLVTSPARRMAIEVTQ